MTTGKGEVKRAVFTTYCKKRQRTGAQVLIQDSSITFDITGAGAQQREPKVQLFGVRLMELLGTFRNPISPTSLANQRIEQFLGFGGKRLN